MTSQSTVPENQTRNWFRSGTPWVWLTGAAIGVSLLAMLAVVLMLAWQGGRYLWPQPVWQFTLSSQVAGEPRAMLGEIYAPPFYFLYVILGSNSVGHLFQRFISSPPPSRTG